MLHSFVLKIQQLFQSPHYPQRAHLSAIGGYPHLWGNNGVQSGWNHIPHRYRVPTSRLANRLQYRVWRKHPWVSRKL